MSYATQDTGWSANSATSYPVGASSVASQTITMGGFTFRMLVSEASTVLQVARATSASPIQLYAIAEKNAGSFVLSSINLESITVAPTFLTLSDANSTITASYQKVEFDIGTRDGTNSIWNISMFRNGNSSAHMTVQYFGIPRANS